MIDLTELRKNPELFKQQILKKDPSYPIDILIKSDFDHRQLLLEVEVLRKEKNEISKSSSGSVSVDVRQRSIQIGKELKEKEATLAVLEKKFNDLYLSCPNPMHADVPAGNKPENKEVTIFGSKPTFNFTPKDHLTLGNELRWFDFQAAAKVTGSNFAWYKGDAVKLLYALTRMMLQTNIKHGFYPMLAPYLVNTKSLEACGQLPKFADGVYKIEGEDLYLIPTSEVSLLNYHRDEILSSEQLPQRFTSWTSCFRREAGTYGATERGLIRIHQFEKVELVSFTKPEDSYAELDRMIACGEEILQKLGLHYRVMLLAAQDASFQSAKTYDIEVWMPGQGSFYEVSSASNCTDFQARRAKIRYKENAGAKSEYVHTLNASSLALPRLMVALMETYQQSDGSIQLPACLVQQGW
ncbi:serine--tRNA ligase [candidate division TM6 bacterium RIFCSPHIGHO2_12_FULL_38_8]|nr:MAG: serine--tRNA ligase [candidate division TM6 bacterium RIFCSPHIGHO2_12_FULL_38_8]